MRETLRSIVVTILLGALVLAVTAGCSTSGSSSNSSSGSSSGSIVGTYINKADQSDVMKLKSDGTFQFNIGDIGLHGRYETEGNSISFLFPDGSAVQATKKGRTITFSSSMMEFYMASTWLKQ